MAEGNFAIGDSKRLRSSNGWKLKEKGEQKRGQEKEERKEKACTNRKDVFRQTCLLGTSKNEFQPNLNLS